MARWSIFSEKGELSERSIKYVFIKYRSIFNGKLKVVKRDENKMMARNKAVNKVTNRLKRSMQDFSFAQIARQ